MIDNGFEAAWQRFADLSRGKLIEKSRQSALTPAAAQLAVRTAAGTWTARSECGLWLEKLRGTQPEKAKAVLKLIDEISFEEVAVPPPISDLTASVVTLGGAAIGASLSAKVFNWAAWASALSAVVPAAVLYPSMKKLQRAQKQSNEARILDGYMEQLSEVKKQILDTIYY